MKFTHIEYATADNRGNISDILYKEPIEHVSIIDTVGGRNVVRGNHYHKETRQWIFITKGGLYYWYKGLDNNSEAQFVKLGLYDMVETPPNEIHALHILEETQFVVFTAGKRGGGDYESDTFRVPAIFDPKFNYEQVSKTAVIFGATGDIGKATTFVFREAGYNVVELSSKDCDLRYASQDRIREITDSYCPDVIVHAAGIIDSSMCPLNDVFSVNFMSACRLALSYLYHSPKKHTSIVLIGSSSYNRSSPIYPFYAASKAALVSLVGSIGPRFSGTNASLNLINLGKVDSSMRRKFFPNEPKELLLTTDEVGREILKLAHSGVTGQIETFQK